VVDNEISEEGRRARFERWEQLGPDQVKHDLLNGGRRVVGGPPAVRALAWEWVRMKEANLMQPSMGDSGPSTNEAAYTMAAAKAVYAAIEGLVSAGQRAYAHSVPRAAASILVRQGAGRVGQNEANNDVRAAIVGLAKQGKIEAHAEPRYDWLINEPLEQENENMTTYNKVFIVHGHDDGTRESVARFIEKLGFEAIILHERPNKGRTIITKFREEAEGVGFAVVLMTPDDLGKAKDASDLNPRARQNVVFELGFFIGVLGPERVAAAMKGNVERPSDFDGVVYISLDQANWQSKLGGELKAAGFDVDWNKVMG
jgi:predicted nucleotide-binding protein